MQHSEQLDQLATALATAQGAFRSAAKDATNPHFRSKYADLAAVIEAVRTPLAQAGLSVVQQAVTTEQGIAVTTRLLHKSGQWLEFDPLTVPMMKSDAHGVGSATTYARRYALGAVLAIAADEDDDGNAAVQRPAQDRKPVAAPAGYAAFLSTLEAAAMDGMPALEAAWKAQPANLRRYLTDAEPKRWESLKDTAAQVPVHA